MNGILTGVIILLTITNIVVIFSCIMISNKKTKDNIKDIEFIKSMIGIEVNKIHLKNCVNLDLVFTDKRQVEIYKKNLIEKSLFTIVSALDKEYHNDKKYIDIDIIEYYIIAYVNNNINIKVDDNPNRLTKVMKPDDKVNQSVDIGQSIMDIYKD